MSLVPEGELISILDSNEATVSPSGSSTVSPTPTSALACEMCQNYELSLKNAQESERKLQEELKAAKALAQRYENELVEERQYRQNLEKKMMEAAAQTEEQLNESVRSFDILKTQFEKALNSSNAARTETNELFDSAKSHVEKLEAENTELSDRFAKLLGLKSDTASAMREEPIDIASDMDQLQFMCLKMREELIECKAGREFTERELKDEVAVLSAQLKEEKDLREAKENELVTQVNQLQTSLGIANSQISSSESNSLQVEALKKNLQELEEQVKQVQGEKAAIDQSANNYRARCAALQHELDVSEQVQKDFVQLSQSLQIQLEKIRQSDQEVRWQWEDEVTECSSPTCTSNITKLKPKPRCYHCGRIFCSPCVSNSVPAGRHSRPAPVCKVCYTLLNRDSAPFFADVHSS